MSKSKKEISLEEKDLFILEQCSKRYNFYYNNPRREYKKNIKFDLLTKGLEVYTNHLLNNKLISDVETFNLSLKELENKYETIELENAKLIELKDFATGFNLFGLNESVVVQNNLSKKVECSEKLDVKIKINTIYKTIKAGIVRGLVISSYEDVHSIKWSMVHRLQYEVLKDLHKKFSNEDERHRNPLLNIIYYDKGWKNYLMNKSSLGDKWKAKMSLFAQMLDKDFYYPQIPCNISCPYKKECEPL